MTEKDRDRPRKDPNADEAKSTEDMKQLVREDIEEQRKLIEKLRRELN